MTLEIGENPPIAASKVRRDTPLDLACDQTLETKSSTLRANAGVATALASNAALPAANERREDEKESSLATRNMNASERVQMRAAATCGTAR